jgi:peptidylprolyl isomerase
MKHIALILTLVAFAAAARAQSTSKSSATSSPGAKTSSTATAGKSSTATSAQEPWIRLAPGVPKVAHGPVKTVLYPVHYEDITVGAGAEGEPDKVWHIKYVGWRAADGVEFDSWDKHARPVIGKDGRPEIGPDGKPKMNDPEPLAVPQGIGGMIAGLDCGLAGMKIGGKRRIFVPWQLAYGSRDILGAPNHPGIPPKSNLIFDVELVNVTDMPQPRPMMPAPPRPGANAQPNGAPAHPQAQANPAAPAKPAAPSGAQPSAPAPSPAPTQPTTPAQQTAPQTQPK